MTTQLRLVETPKAAERGRRATTTKARSRRAVHWGEWQLDAQTRRVGRAGVAAARQALEQARRTEDLRQAS